MLDIALSADLLQSLPGIHVGLLEISGIDNTPRPTPLDAEKRLIEQGLRQRYAGYGRRDFLALPLMAAYDRYYNRFDKTSHVLLQLESLVLRGKSLPQVSPLVDAGFAAELETLVLTAAHDVDLLQPPVYMDVSRAGETFTQMNGASKVLRAGDMVMRDRQRLVCTFIYGQDAISPVSPLTTHAVYVAYAPAGVPPEAVHAHLELIERHVRLFSPGCEVNQLVVKPDF